ncbi:MAG: cell division protein FtsZ [Candidatus Eisenbacteria bacterium]|uniref:Cell division protein FtsZ n=1 Tax=Eiseniibacteriota bacterium TaxID=2212470 RepID=A0A948RYX5_UNCEI|nr:cell division protein FtsZ [Candidatus Eisenbacteria bacterium]MBU1947537.1 cell division protein FtsZ [Candidatus Eisenbacteria bacterium]MBU2692961.1 cell division protein FtsZ [Candidatus Eisenbacteria bacterium]
MLIEASDKVLSPARLKVIGVGGCGGNAVGRMILEGLEGLEFLVMNTDLQALEVSVCPAKLQIGVDETRGLGTGGLPERGRKAAEEDAETLEAQIQGVDMLFIAAGMGGGTGTGAAPVLARLAKERDILSVAVVTTPFNFEGQPRTDQAVLGIEKLRESVDTLIVVPNQKLLEILDAKTPLEEAYRAADEVLYQATRGISELITIPGIMNRDFADVRSVMKRGGSALMGIGVASGEGAAKVAAQQAISNRLLEDVSIAGAEAVLVNVAGSQKLSIGELSEAVTLIEETAGRGAHVYLGNVIDPSLEGEVRVTVVATGFGTKQRGITTEINKSNERSENPLEIADPLPGTVGAEMVGAGTMGGEAAGAEAVGFEAMAVDRAADEAAASQDTTPEVDSMSRSWRKGAIDPAPTSLDDLPLWNRKEDDEPLDPQEIEEEAVMPLPLTPVSSAPKEGWDRRPRRRTFDIPAFRRRIAR